MLRIRVPKRILVFGTDLKLLTVVQPIDHHHRPECGINQSQDQPDDTQRQPGDSLASTAGI